MDLDERIGQQITVRIGGDIDEYEAIGVEGAVKLTHLW